MVEWHWLMTGPAWTLRFGLDSRNQQVIGSNRTAGSGRKYGDSIELQEHHYWNLVENRRVAGGGVAQRHVLYFGEINDGQRELWRR